MFHAPKLALASLVLCLFAEEVSAALILLGDNDAHIALGSQFNAVGSVQRTTAAGQVEFGLSASLIRSDWAISSKHGFLENDSDPNSLYTNLKVSFDANYLTATTRYNVAQVFLHPTKDMALMRFEVPVQNITPFDLFTGTVVNGMEGFTVGFGNLQYVNDPNVTFTGDRRGGFDVVDGVNLFEPENFKTTFNRTINSNYRPLEMGGRNGDSGGAFILANSGSPTNLLAGIIDSATLTNGFNSLTFYTRIDNEWINSTITSVPEPGSVALLAASSSLLLWRRLRRKAA
jgi:hypothetical protein